MIHRYWHDDGTSRPFPIIDNYVQTRYKTHDWSLDQIPDEILKLIGYSSRYVIPSDLPRHYSNVIRLWALSVYGGIWVDHDIIPLLDLDALELPFAGGHGNLSTSIMGFPPNHPMLRSALDLIAHTGNIVDGELLRSVDVSGGNILNPFLTPDITIYPLLFDASGTPITLHDNPPIAAHLFSTSSLRFLTPKE